MGNTSTLKRLYAAAGLLLFSLVTAGCDYTFYDKAGDKLTFYDPLDVDVLIDGSMDSVLIDSVITAISVYDDLEFIDVNYTIYTDTDTTIYDSELEYEVLFTHYRDTDIDHCSDDDTDVIACNTFYIDDYNEIYLSYIHFNMDVLDRVYDSDPDIYADYVLSVAIHEFGHTFGLDDLYSDYYRDISIMYYNDDGGMFTELLPYDIEWLEDLYGYNDIGGDSGEATVGDN